jgi:hypothetical protein
MPEVYIKIDESQTCSHRYNGRMVAKKQSRRCPLVMVEWEDSAQPRANWQYLADVGEPTGVRCVSVGWLVSDTADCKGVAPNMGAIDSPDSFQVSGLISIPTRCVTRITRLKEPKPKSY